MTTDTLQVAVAQLMDALGLPLDDPNFEETPARVARMYREVLTGLEQTDLKVNAILRSSFPCSNNNLVLVRNVDAYSMCPHHLLPVSYRVHVAYLPNGRVLGLSKLSRLVTLLSARPVLQEQLVEDITTALMKVPGCEGAACIAEGSHYCMVMRGVKQSNATVVASSLKGSFFQDPTARQELMKLIYQ